MTSPPSCSVEKPFLKAVVLVGPDTGERAALLARLAAEFPDVFAFPRAHTTRSPEEERRAHVAADGAWAAEDEPGGRRPRGRLAFMASLSRRAKPKPARAATAP